MKNKNKKANLFLFTILLTAGFFGFGAYTIASSDLNINEILYDPKGTDSGHTDWIELYNNSSSMIQLKKDSFGILDEKDLKLGSDRIHYTTCHKLSSDISIDSHGFIILADNATEFKNDYPKVDAGAIVDTTIDLSSDDAIRLSFDKCATFFTEIAYDNSWGGKDGKTLEKIDPTSDNSKINWQESYISGGTPGFENFTGDDKEIEYSDQIIINELLPHPSAGDEEFVELYNLGEKEESLDGWKLKDKGGNICNIYDKKIKTNGYLAIKESDFSSGCNISLNDTGGEIISLYNTRDESPVSIAEYSETAKINFSWSFDGKEFKWTKYLTPGGENEFEIPKEYNEKVYLNEIFPNPENEEDEFIEIYNSDEKGIDLSGWILRDSSKTGEYVIPDGTLIGAGVYFVIYKKDYKFALNNSGSEIVNLLDPNEKEVSDVSYEKAKENVSYNFNGTNWRWSKDITPGRKK